MKTDQLGRLFYGLLLAFYGVVTPCWAHPPTDPRIPDSEWRHRLPPRDVFEYEHRERNPMRERWHSASPAERNQLRRELLQKRPAPSDGPRNPNSPFFDGPPRNAWHNASPEQREKIRREFMERRPAGQDPMGH